MQAYLAGTILEHTNDGAIVLVAGVGYACAGSWLKSIPPGDEVTLFTYHYLENQSVPRLIAVKTSASRELLIELISVSGVGPKMAGSILDALTPHALLSAITSSDIDTLTSVKGLGKKTAQKIILELGKTLVLDSTVATHPYFEALVSLGFTRSEIETAIKSTDVTGLSDNQAVTALLRSLGRSG